LLRIGASRRSVHNLPSSGSLSTGCGSGCRARDIAGDDDGMELSDIARRDIFSAAAASRHGLDSDAIARAVVSGRAHPLIPGWYSVRLPTDLTDWHRLAARAAYLRFEGRAMVSHHSALAWASLPVHRADLGTVHLTRSAPGSSRRRPRLMIHRSVPGLPVADRVPLAVAIVQSGLSGEPLTALIAADAALHSDRVDHGDLDQALDLFTRSRGIGPVRAILAHADARVESPGESIIGHRLRQLGWAVVPQHPVDTDLGQRYADFRFEGTKVLVEFDGAVKYRGAEGGDVVFAEKRREDAMRRKGWFFARYVWSEVDDLDLIERRVQDALVSAAAA
jgi:very-short-patch-repair endonuclease